MHNVKNKKTSQQGFTLIELSIVLLVVSILTSTLLQFIAEQSKERSFSVTNDKLEQIDAALIAHLNAHGYLPCPAKRGTALESSDFGVATNCLSAVDADVIEVTSDTVEENVRIGDLPTRNLGLPDDFMFDAWQRRITYAVVVDLAKEEYAYNDYVTDQENGVIQILDAGSFQIPQAPATCSSDTSTCPVIAYLFLSHGSDGKGAYNRIGGLYDNACGASLDSENCDYIDPDEDHIFVDSFINDGEVVAKYFDDIVIWKENRLARRQANIYVLP